jgi:hypothetical protein
MVCASARAGANKETLMLKTYVASALLLIVGIATNAQAQDLQVKSNSSYYVFNSQNTATVSEDRVAVRGISSTTPYWGVGGHFEGGYVGVRANATIVGSGFRYAGYFTAAGGDGTNYGVYSLASGTNAYAGYFMGNVYVSGTFSQTSDLRLKTNLQDLPQGVLAQVLKLRPKSYRYRTAAFPQLSLPATEQIGLVAQDVQAVFPQLVSETTAPGNPDDKGAGSQKFLAIDYLKLVPLLVKAVQEQQAQIEQLKADVAALRRR